MVADIKLQKIRQSTNMLLFKLNESSEIVVLLFLVFVANTYNQDSKQQEQLSIGNFLWQDCGEVG